MGPTGGHVFPSGLGPGPGLPGSGPGRTRSSPGPGRGVARQNRSRAGAGPAGTGAGLGRAGAGPNRRRTGPKPNRNRTQAEPIIFVVNRFRMFGFRFRVSGFGFRFLVSGFAFESSLSGGRIFQKFLEGHLKAGVNFPNGPNWKCGAGGKLFWGNFENLTGPRGGNVFPSRAGMGFAKTFHGPKRK